MYVGGEIYAGETSGGTIFNTFFAGAVEAIVNAVAAVEEYQRCKKEDRMEDAVLHLESVAYSPFGIVGFGVVGFKIEGGEEMLVEVMADGYSAVEITIRLVAVVEIKSGLEMSVPFAHAIPGRSEESDACGSFDECCLDTVVFEFCG